MGLSTKSDREVMLMLMLEICGCKQNWCPGERGERNHSVKFGCLECASGKLSLRHWFTWCSLVVYTSRLVGCLGL